MLFAQGSVRKFRSTDYYARLDDGTHQHQHQQQPDSPTFEHFPHTSTGNSAKSEDVGKFIDVRPNVSDSFYSNSAHMSARSESAVGGLSLSSSGGGGGGGGSGGIRAEEKTSLYSMVEGGEENLSLEEHSV